MKLSNHSAVPVYTVSGSSTARPLPEWLARKRKRSLKQDAEYASRVELLQDFEFEEASSCVRVSEDGNWVMSTGTYKPQIHVHNLANLSLSFARHTDALNEKFVLLSSDYSKSLHLQSDRFLELHTPTGRHHTTRVPRYGRDLVYDRRSAEALIPTVGVNENGTGEVFRLNLDLGRFMKGYEVDVGGDDTHTVGFGSLQGGVDTGAINAAAVAEETHNLLAFGTSLGTVEFWDSRVRNRVGVLLPPSSGEALDSRKDITCLEFGPSGLNLATGNAEGIVRLYDLRSPLPILKKDQGYGYPIKNLIFLGTPRTHSSEPKILSADKRIVKIWDARDGTPWTSVEPAVDLNHVAWVPHSGMLLTANEGRQQHCFFIPQLGPAPRWCAFLDNLTEEMAENPEDPNAFSSRTMGEVYDNYKFLTILQLRQLGMDHLVGKTNLLRPYMHGYFVAQRLYDEARLIANPELWEQQRAKSVRERIEKERESRIRGSKKVKVKVNRKLAEKLLEREEKEARYRSRKVLLEGVDREDVSNDEVEELEVENVDANVQNGKNSSLRDPRFARLFENEDFEVDENSYEFRALNPSTKTEVSQSVQRLPKGLTAVELEELEEVRISSGEESGEYADDSHATHRKQRGKRQGDKDDQQIRKPRMVVSSSNHSKPAPARDKFSSRKSSEATRSSALDDAVGEKQVSFVPRGKPQARGQENEQTRRAGHNKLKDRRSASGNTFRRM